MKNSEDKTTYPVTSFANRVRETMTRLELNEKETAEYLAIPLFTLRKWIRGEREPSAAVIRLFDVLGMIESMAPAVHECFLPPERVKK